MNRKKQLLIILFAIFAAMGLCACSEDPSLQTVKYKGSITVGYYPGSYLNEPVVNIIKAIAYSMEIDVYFKDETKETWQADLHNDEIDMMIDEATDEDMLSDILFTAKVAFISHKDAQLAQGGLVGVLDVGFIRDSAAAVTDFHNAKYVYYAIPDMMIADFESGYLDGIIVNEVDYTAYNSLENADYNKINERNIYIVFEQGDYSLLEEFNTKLNELRENDALDDLIYTE